MQTTLVSLLWRFQAPFPLEAEKLRASLRRTYPREAAVNVRKRDGSETEGILMALAGRPTSESPTACVYAPHLGDVTIKGTVLEDVTKMHDKVVVALGKALPDFEAKIKFAEAWYEGWKHAKGVPLERFHDLLKADVAGSWGKAILGVEAGAFGIRICHSDPFPPVGPINEVACWRELRVEPMVMNPENYLVSIIIRDRSAAKVKKEFRELGRKLKWLQQELRSGHDD